MVYAIIWKNPSTDEITNYPANEMSDGIMGYLTNIFNFFKIVVVVSDTVKILASLVKAVGWGA